MLKNEAFLMLREAQLSVFDATRYFGILFKNVESAIALNLLISI